MSYYAQQLQRFAQMNGVLTYMLNHQMPFKAGKTHLSANFQPSLGKLFKA